MSLLAIVKITAEAHTTLQEFLLDKPFIPLFFFSPYSLNTWLNHDAKSLYIATLGSEKLLIVHKEVNEDIRVLFDHPSKEMISVLVEHFHPKYLAVNDCVTQPETGEFILDLEYEIMLQPIADLTDGNVRKKYNQARRKNANLVYEPYKPQHAEGIKMFLRKWNTTRSDQQNEHAKTHNDLHFLEMYKDDPKVLGGVVLDGKEIVAYSLCVPSLDGQVLAMFNKVLRGYIELGVFVYVERARQLTALGYSRAHIGPINNDFKKQFLAGAVAHEAYCYMIHSELKVMNEKRYLMTVF